MEDQEKHQYCTNQFIELANRLKDEKIDPNLVSGALMTASGIYATYVAAGNEGALEPSGVKKASWIACRRFSLRTCSMKS